MPVVHNKTIGYAKVGEIVIYVSAKNKSPSNEDFTIYLRFLEQQLKPGTPVRSVVYERFDGITATQRKLLRDVIDSHSPIVAVMTASAIARGIVTALSWFNKDFKAFSPEDRAAAFRHVGLSPAMAAEAWRVIQALEKELD